MGQQVTRNNHYVPEWYQKGFLDPGASQLYYLDTTPDTKELPNGRVITCRDVSKREPGGNFCKVDLYTTRFGSSLNDEIERYLFGKIDNEGAKAIRALIDGDLPAIHNSFESFFEYLDAQKLRTPKGLDWIKSRYPALTQPELMREMQGLRLMHCAMWTEGVREIVSAEQSDVKFIVTDHPITIYNAALPPGSKQCEYPEDPAIDLIGSQTIFALNADTCIILTHLEYANQPDKVELIEPRTNARYIGQSIVRTDAFIRKRKLNREEVIAINYLLKRRASRYVAAANREWLYPENSYSGDWAGLAEILLPRDDLWQFGGDIYVGYADGSTYYQDAFGRTSDAHKYLQKKRSPGKPRPNAPCGCGSGLKFKQCCKGLPEQDRPSWDVYGIRERNLMFCHEVKNILGLNSGKTWEDVQRELSDENVKNIYEAFGSLWPVDTDLIALLPRPTSGILRAVYLGAADPRLVSSSITGWLAYFDQVIVANPFLNPANIRPEYSPTKSPSQHKEQTLKNVFLLLILEPYIEAGYVHLIPEDMNSLFTKTVISMASERTTGWKPDEEDLNQFKNLQLDDYNRHIRRLPERSLRAHIRQTSPELNSSQVDSVVAYMKAELKEDPLALLQPIEPGDAGAQATIIKGYNLESAMFLASLTGSAIYTDLKTHWRQLHQYTTAIEPSKSIDTWRPVIEAVKTIVFPIELDWKISLDARRDGKYGQMRSTIRHIAEAAQDNPTKARINQLTTQLSLAAEAAHSEWAQSSSKTRLDGHLELSIPQDGFERNEIRRLLLTFGRAKYVRPIKIAFFIQLSAIGARRH